MPFGMVKDNEDKKARKPNKNKRAKWILRQSIFKEIRPNTSKSLIRPKSYKINHKFDYEGTYVSPWSKWNQKLSKKYLKPNKTDRY